MTKEELLNIVRKGENKRVEFKQVIDRPERIAEEIVAFANLEGGLILFGVDDSGIVRGFDTPSATQPKGLTPSDMMRGKLFFVSSTFKILGFDTQATQPKAYKQVKPFFDNFGATSQAVISEFFSVEELASTPVEDLRKYHQTLKKSVSAVLMVIQPPCGVKFIAFESRFSTTLSIPS